MRWLHGGRGVGGGHAGRGQDSHGAHAQRACRARLRRFWELGAGFQSPRGLAGRPGTGTAVLHLSFLAVRGRAFELLAVSEGWVQHPRGKKGFTSGSADSTHAAGFPLCPPPPPPMPVVSPCDSPVAPMGLARRRLRFHSPHGALKLRTWFPFNVFPVGSGGCCGQRRSLDRCRADI